MVTSAPLTLVTGASSGIGRAIAIHLSASRSVLLHGRDSIRLNETLKSCAPGDHRIWSVDLNDVGRLQGSLTRLFGDAMPPIVEFIHCAGLPSAGGARLLSAKQMQYTFNVNTLSALEICSTLLKKNNRPSLKSILFISSIWGRYGAVGHTLYSATKGALDSAMRSLAVELAPVTRVNSLALGAVETPMAEKALSDSEIRAHAMSNYPLGIGTTDDVAMIVEFVLSDAAKWMTGQVIVADGGRTTHMSNK